MNPADRDSTFGAGAAEPLLSVRDLHVEIDTEDGVLTAVNPMSFDLYAGEVLAIVGESGCGKTMTALSILGLLPREAARLVRGEVRLGGEDLLAALPQRMRQVRGAEIAMIFQEPLTALNPVQRVGDQIAEMIRTHRPVRRSEARRRTLSGRNGRPSQSDRRNAPYPHRPSRWMRLRSPLPHGHRDLPGARGQVPGARCQVPGVRCQVPGARGQVPGARCQVPGARCQVPGARCQVPGARCQGSGARGQVPGVRVA